MKVFRPFFVIAVLILIVSLACGAFAPSEPTPVPQPVQLQPVDSPTQASQPLPPVEQQPTDAPAPAPVSSGPFFTEEFDADPQWYYEVIEDNGGDSDPESVTTSFEFGRMIFDIPESFLYAYYIYEGEIYEDVRVDIKLENRGVNTQQVSLVCRVSDEGWYEWAVQSDGLWYLYAVSGGYRRLTNGGSNDIKQGKDINEYGMECKGNEISFFINGEEQRGSPYVDRDLALRRGNVGFSVSSLRAIPVKIEVDWFKVSEP